MNVKESEIHTFKQTIWEYYHTFGRHDMAWRQTTDPFNILVSEIMLQQTQVSRVTKKYQEFITAFPTFRDLAEASVEQVLRVWQGMGYNRRVLFLKKTAQRVVDECNGTLPGDPEVLVSFPGIGKNTAGSVAAFAFNKPVVFIETNIRRVFIHHFFQDAEGVHDSDILPLVERTLDQSNAREWYWALMDYGTMLATTIENPNKKSRHYVVQSKFEGSNRQVRGKILKLLLSKSSLTEGEILDTLKLPLERVQKNLQQLTEEGFIYKIDNNYRLANM